MIANYMGRGWSALMGLAFIPMYARLMGVEAMGVIGLFVTLQALCLLLDAGLSTTLNRELARMSLDPKNANDMRNLLRTFEAPFWASSCVGGLIIFALAPFIAHHWVHVLLISPNSVQIAIRLMGVVLFFQLPLSLYGGGLLGLQRQIEYSLLNALWYTLRFAGAILALKFFGATLLTFFVWQVVVSVLASGLSALVLWRSLPKGIGRARFDRSLLASRWKFAAGLGGISLTLLILNNVDKVILSRAVSLQAFGYYTLAWTLANAVRILADPLYVTFFPRMSQVWASGDQTELAALYHTVCRLMAIAIIPLGLTMAFFAPEALLCWTRSPLMVENTTSLVRLLAVGNVCLALTIVPYALQLASGWTGLAFWSNLVAAALLVPLMAVLASRYGTLGGGIAWTALNASYLVVTVALMHRKLLPGHLRHWALSDVGQPLLAVALTLSVARVLLPHVQSPLNALMAIGFAYAFAQLASVIASPLRPQIAGRLKSISIGAKG
jgi:O-antigen/teichoic acid export membrane protein